MANISQSVCGILEKNPLVFYDEHKNKVICRATGNEMIPREDAINAYISGKKYQHLLKKSTVDIPPELQQHIVTDKDDCRKAVCRLTLSVINNTCNDILRHTQGKTFNKALLIWKDCQSRGETFKPQRRRRTRPKVAPGNVVKNVNTPTEVKQETLSDIMQDDDFSDLYPAKYFEEMTLSDNDDDEYEDTDSNVDTNTENAGNHGDTATPRMDTGQSVSETMKRKAGKRISKIRAKKTSKLTS